MVVIVVVAAVVVAAVVVVSSSCGNLQWQRSWQQLIVVAAVAVSTCSSVDFRPAGPPIGTRPGLVLWGELVTHVERRRTDLPSDVVVLAARAKVNSACPSCPAPTIRFTAKGGRKSDS